MKTRFILLFALLVFGTMPEVSSVYASPNVNFQSSNPRLEKRIKRAQELIDSGDYTAARKMIETIRNMAPNDSRIQDLVNQCDAAEERIRQEMEDAYQSAINSGSRSALEDFKAKYPDSEHIEDVNNRIQDYSLWSQALNTNTIDGYRKYKNSTSIGAFSSQADEKIQTLQSEQAWNACKNSNSENLLSDFIKKYPKSGNIKEANYKLNIIRGLNSFKGNDYDSAREYLTKASKYHQLTGEAADALKQINEKRDYDTAINSKDASTLGTYLNSISTTSKYYDSASSEYAILLANGLDKFSTESDYAKVRSYAKNNKSVTEVEKCISKAAQARKEYEHQLRVEARKEWWKGRFTMGWTILNCDYWSEAGAIGTGLRFRFGRYSDVFNFIFGGQFTYNLVVPTEEGEEVEKIGTMVDIPVTLRINTFKVGTWCKFYIGCSYIYGIRIADGDYELNKHSMAIEPQIGFGRQHFDFGIYYRKYFKNNNILKTYKWDDTDFSDQRAGFFMTWYF